MMVVFSAHRIARSVIGRNIFVVGIVFSFLNPLINTFWIITLRTDVPCIGAQPRTGINAQFQAHIMKVVGQFLHIGKLPI